MKQAGFTLLEMVLVLMFVGTLTSLGLPLMELLVQQTKLNDERAAIAEARHAVIGYALGRGALPAPAGESRFATGGAGGIAATGTGLTLPHATLALRARGHYAQPLRYDVMDVLVEGTQVDLCTRIQAALDTATAAPAPHLCADPGCTRDTAVAFVIVSAGPNHRLDDHNAAHERRYDNPARGPGPQYDDLVASVSLYELYRLARCTRQARITSPATNPPAPFETRG